MKTKRKIVSRIFSLIFYIIAIIICVKLFNIYKTFDFNEFIKGEYVLGITKFTRDDEIKYSEENSYKISSEEFNDAIFYKEIEVKPNTVYKVSCMVKTENIEVEKDNSDAGAMISILENSEVSESIRGTNDWQEMSMVFNSKAREKIKLGFRLGGNDANAKGTVWFSNIKLEEGITSTDTDWKMACFIIKQLDVNIEETQYQFKMSLQDIENIKSNIIRFEKACEELSNKKMTAKCDIYEIEEPITTISYSDEHKYYIDPQDMRKHIGKTIIENEYDYVFTVVRLGNENISISTEDWIGLGGMRIYDVGYSVIRMPDEKNNYIYTYDARINLFPEEVLLHEFLHTLEAISKDYNYEIPELHDYKEYGYNEESLIGLKKWYKDYMRCTILDEKTGKYVGLNEDVYALKPAHISDFEYSIEIEFNKEPQNIIEEIKHIFTVLSSTLQYIQKNN